MGEHAKKHHGYSIRKQGISGGLVILNNRHVDSKNQPKRHSLASQRRLSCSCFFFFLLFFTLVPKLDGINFLKKERGTKEEKFHELGSWCMYMKLVIFARF